MDIQAQTAHVTVPNTAAGAASGKLAVAGGSDKPAGGKANISGFAALLQSLSSGEEFSSEELTASMAGLLQGIVPVLPNMPQLEEAEADPVQFARIAVSAILSDAGLAEQVMKDPKLQLWLDQAAALLPSLSGGNAADGTLAVSAGGALTANGADRPALPTLTQTSQLPSTASQTLVQPEQAQAILAMFTAALEEKPNNSELRALAQSFQQELKSLLQGNSVIQAAVASSKLASSENNGAAAAGRGVAEVFRPRTAGFLTKLNTPLDSQVNQGGQSSEPIFVAPTESEKSPLRVLAVKTPSLPANVAEQTANSAQLADNASDPAVSAAPGAPIPLKDLQHTVQLGQHAKPAGQQQISAQNFAQDMSQFMLKNMKVTLGSGVTEAKISLHPQHLGQVDVKITMENGVLAAQFTAETLRGKETLENQLPQLRAALQSQGIQVDKLVVNQSSNLQSGFFHGERQHSSQQFSQQSKNRQKAFAYDSLDGEFTRELTAIAAIRQSAYGNSFDVTA